MRDRKCHSKIIGASITGAAALSAYLLLIRPWHLRWGATDEETRLPLPGDELVAGPDTGATHAITIDAPVSEVWPWLVQIGQDKGGFYSYTWLENLVGCHMHNADRVVPEFQKLQVGDTVRLHPKAPPLPVLICDPLKALVLGSNMDSSGTWGFYLKELGENRTRLIIRGRGGWRAGLLNWIVKYVVFEPAHFIMERKMLIGIRDRVESSNGARSNVRA